MEQKIPYFDFRANYKRLFMDSTGYWSYPIFVRSKSGKILWMYIILKSRTDTKSNSHYLFRPHAILLTPPNSKQVIKFESFRHGHDPFPKVSWDIILGKFPHPDIQKMTVAEFKKREDFLLHFCAKETEVFQSEQKISDEFRTIWLKMCNPAFSDFIKYLSPEFHDLIWTDTDKMTWE
jgi:hypothetical protein